MKNGEAQALQNRISAMERAHSAAVSELRADRDALRLQVADMATQLSEASSKISDLQSQVAVLAPPVPVTPSPVTPGPTTSSGSGG